MSTGADPKTMPVTKEYEDGFERTFGKDRKPVRGKWVIDPKTGKSIPFDQYRPGVEPSKLLVGTDRHHEGNKAPDGTDIGNAKKLRAWMKETGLAESSDFSPGYLREQRASQERADDRARVDTVGRSHYRHQRGR